MYIQNIYPRIKSLLREPVIILPVNELIEGPIMTPCPNV